MRKRVQCAKYFLGEAFDPLKLLTMTETVYEILPKSQGTPYKDWATTGKEDKASSPKLTLKPGTMFRCL